MKRYEVIAIRNCENDVYLIGTAHNEKERYYLCFKALLQGFDYINFYEY